MAGKPKKLLSHVNTIINALTKYKDAIFHHNTITGKSFQVWGTISAEINGLPSPLALYTVVMKNRYNVWEHLGIGKDDAHESEKSVIEDRLIGSDDEMDEDEDTDTFRNIQVIKRPKEVVYEKNIKRGQTVFKARSWTNALYRHFHELTGLPCTLQFKRATICPTLEVYAKIYGKCKECDAQFRACIQEEPEPNSRVHVHCMYTGNYKVIHNGNLKRHLFGIFREEAVKEMTEKNIAFGMIRKLQAQRDMEFRGSEPKDLPSANALRVAKHQAVKETFLSENPVEAVYRMMGIRPFKGIIRDLGYCKFRVFYWSSSQIHVYRQYCRNYAPNSKVSIDATGGVVKRLNRPWGEKSSYVFLYEITVQEPITHRQYSVGKMLSESHDSDSIYFWLSAWLRTGAIPPNEVVTDMSLALLYAVAKAFAKCHSLGDYLKICWSNIFQNMSTLPQCYVRCDVAHVVKLMVQFPSLKKHIRRTRQFYLRALGQVIQCEMKEDLENLLRAIFTVAICETEGMSICTGKPTICEIRKNWLISRVASGEKKELSSILDNNDSFTDTRRVQEESPVTSPFQEWVKSIADNCRKECETPEEEGERGNQQIEPLLVNDIVKISRLLPLWTALMKPKFGSVYAVGSSAPVESSFSELKGKTFAHCTLPLRADKFLETHILAIDGAMKLASTDILQQLGKLENYTFLRNNPWNW